MSPAVIGLFVGILLGIAFEGQSGGGFHSVLVALFFGAIGYGVGGQLSGQFDLRELFKGRKS